jgi:hypothetical protein
MWVCGEREGSRVQKGSNAPDGAGSIKNAGDREREGEGGNFNFLLSVKRSLYVKGQIWTVFPRAFRMGAAIF